MAQADAPPFGQLTKGHAGKVVVRGKCVGLAKRMA